MRKTFPTDRQTSFPGNARLDLMDREEQVELLHMLDLAKTRRDLHEPLYQLCTRGPVWDGDVISKSHRDELIALGACAKVLVKGEDGFNAATYFGSYLLKAFDWMHGPLGART